MLQNPNLDETPIIRALEDGYGLRVASLSFLPIGYDVNTVIYQATAAPGNYFVKLRRGAFDEICVAVPEYLHRQGITEVMAPLESAVGEWWVNLGEYRMIVYPFIDGYNGYEGEMSQRQWRTFGAAMRAIHDAQKPAELLRRIPRESYSARGREFVRECIAYADVGAADDAAAKRLRQILRERSEVIERIVSRADELSAELKQIPRPFVLCHTDIHAGNVLLGANDALHIVDWDNPLLAPRERDLMYIGAWGSWSDQRNVQLFYEGYGATAIDQAALVYYRYEHFVQDLYEWCKMLLLTTDGGEDRDQSIQYLEGCFAPDGEAMIALLTDRM